MLLTNLLQYFLFLWSYLLSVAKNAFRTRVLAMLHALSRVAIGNVYVTDFVIEVFPDAGWRIPAEAQLCVDLVRGIEETTAAQIFGPFSRESEYRWRLRGPFEIAHKPTSVKLVTYILVASGHEKLHVGSLDIDDKRLLSMRLSGSQGWSDTLYDGDGRPTSKMTVHVQTSGESSDMKGNKPDIVDTVTELLSFTWAIQVVAAWRKSNTRTAVLAGIEAIESPWRTLLFITDGYWHSLGWRRSIGDLFHSQFWRTDKALKTELPDDLVGSGPRDAESVDDVEEVIERLQEVLSLAPDDHPEKPAWLSILGNTFRRRSECIGSLSDVDEAIKNMRHAILLTPNVRPEKPGWLSDLGMLLQRRFGLTGDFIDIEEAINYQQQAISLTPDAHPGKPGLLCATGSSFEIRFRHTGTLNDIEDAIRNLQRALSLTPDGHPDKPVWLSSLGNLFQSRFGCTAVFSDVAAAIENLQQGIALASDGHPDKPGWLHDLGTSLQNQFRHTRESRDIGEAIRNHQLALLLTPDGHPERPARLVGLGKSFQSRYEHAGMPHDIEEAIKNLQQAVLLTLDGHSDKPGWFNEIGNSLRSRFLLMGELIDIEEAIKCQRQAVLLTAPEATEKSGFLYSLGVSFVCRFQRTGVLEDIEEAIQTLRHAVTLTQDGHSERPARLSNLGVALQSRFGCTGVLNDLEDAILNQQHAVLFTPDGHPNKPRWLNNLANSLRSRFKRTGVLSDIEEAINNHQRAVLLTPDGHPDKSARLNDLGSSFGSRFGHTGILSDIDEAIKNVGEAVSLTVDGHPDKPLRLNNLGCFVQSRFRYAGRLGDDKEAAQHLMLAASLIPDGHPEKPSCLNNLGNSFRSTFGLTGLLRDIDDAIKNQQQAVFLTPDGHPDKPEWLSNLGRSFQSRFGLTCVLGDIEEAVRAQRQAVLLTPDGHPDKPARLSSLGNSFQSRFRRTGSLSDIEEAITNQQQAVFLTPDGHPGKPAWLYNLGISLGSRFGHTGVIDDIDDAISKFQQALSLTPDGNPDKPARLNDLGHTFQGRFWRLGVRHDIEEAIRNLEEAILLAPTGHADIPTWLSNLGSCFESRFGHTMIFSDFDTAVMHFRSAATSSTGPPSVRSHASRQWARLIAKHDTMAALDAYGRAIHLLPQIAWIGDPVSARHFQLNQLDDLSREAAAFALDAGQPDLALEWLEQGRSVVWNQMLNLRTSVDDLREIHPDFFDEFTYISRHLHSAAVREEGVEQSFGVSISLEEQTQQHHRLAERWDLLVEDIRSLPGFEDFLLPRKVSILRKAAELGPVVVINVHERRSDALVLLKGKESVHHIPLSKLPYSGVEAMLQSLKTDLAMSSGARAARAKKVENLTQILSKLFSGVVLPILEGLDMMSEKLDSSDLPRIWWCPTGPLSFLPLHAASINTPEVSDGVFNHVVSSYIPSVNALLRARAGDRRPFNALVGVAMANNPPQHGLAPLPNVIIELEKIAALFPAESDWRFKTLLNKEATKERVLSDMASSSWIHFACHGTQDTQEPMHSGVWLHDGALIINDFICKQFDHADFAFLSACHTSTGDEKFADEAVHTTAAMLGSGYRSIIGTMWSISDEVAPVIVAKFYQALLLDGTPDSERAARALHEGVKMLRESGGHGLFSWVPFVHHGL